MRVFDYKKLEERKWNNDIIGKIAEIQYFEETKDQNGHLSLRFPVFRGLRTDKDEISYN